MARQATLVLLKPDAMQRGMAGAVFSRLEPLRLEVIGAKVVRPARVLAEEHYQNIRGKAFFDETVDYLQGKFHGGSPVLAFVLWGEDAIERVRQIVGATHPEKADPQSIRGVFGRMRTGGLMENTIHASSDIRDAEREIRLWFKPSELLQDPFPAGQRVGAP